MRAFVFAAAAFAAASAEPANPFSPWGTHLAYGNEPTREMSVMWSTRLSPEASAVVDATLVATGTTTRFLASSAVYSDAGNTQTIHTSRMTGLVAGGRYTYVVGDGSPANSSATFSFVLQPAADGEWGAGRSHPVLTIYGDVGVAANSHKTLPLLYADALSGAMDVVLHIGDIAYDLQSANGASGDAFVTEVEPFAANLPVHYCPGNHEDWEDFGQYRARFDMMPGGAEVRKYSSCFHSFNVGLVHVVMFSSEAFFNVGAHSLLMLPDQFAFVEADLQAVDRSVTPWIITMAHQPMYCSPNDDDDDCHSLLSLMRDGVLGEFGFEKLINAYGVEMHFGAHEHSYERNVPVYQYAFDASKMGPEAYVDFNRTVHILSGAAGCPENQDGWQANGNPFSVVRINDYGYGRLSPVNFTHMHWEYVDDVNATVLDSVWLVKTSHGPFTSAELEEPVPAEVLAARRARALEAAAAAIREAGGHMTPAAARKLNGERRE